MIIELEKEYAGASVDYVMTINEVIDTNVDWKILNASSETYLGILDGKTYTKVKIKLNVK